MSAWLERLTKSKFVRDTLFLQSATALDLVTTLVVTGAQLRVLGENGYGTWSAATRTHELVTLLLSIGLVQATLSRLPAAVAAGDGTRVRELLGFFWRASLWLNGALALGAALVTPLVARYAFGLEDPSVGYLAALLVLVLPLGIPSRIVSTALQGSRRMEELAYYENAATLQRTACLLAGLAVAALVPEDDGRAVLWVVVGRLAGAALNSVWACVLYRRWSAHYAGRGRADVDLPSLSEIRRARPARGMLRELGFSVWVGLDKNLATIVALVPFMVLGWATSAEQEKRVFALFNLAMRLLSFPLQALNAVSRNALVKLAERRGARDHAGFFRVFWQVTLGSGAYGIAAVAVVVATAPWLIAILGGDEYRAAVPYLQLLAAYVAIQGFGTGLGSIFNVYERVRASIVIKAVVLVTLFPLGLYWAETFADPVIAVTLYHVTQMGVIIVLAFLLVGHLRRQPLP